MFVKFEIYMLSVNLSIVYGKISLKLKQSTYYSSAQRENTGNGHSVGGKSIIIIMRSVHNCNIIIIILHKYTQVLLLYA